MNVKHSKRKAPADQIAPSPNPSPGDIVTWVRKASGDGWRYMDQENYPYVYLGKLSALNQELWVVKVLSTDKITTLDPRANKDSDGRWMIHDNSTDVEVTLTA